MSTANDVTLVVEDLAGHWTESVLEILKAVGFRRATVDMELDVWQTLRKVLRTELRWQRSFQPFAPVSARALMEQTLRRATLLVAQRYDPQTVSRELENRIGQLVSQRTSNAVERGLLWALVHPPAPRPAFQGPRQSGFVSLPHVSVGGG